MATRFPSLAKDIYLSVDSRSMARLKLDKSKEIQDQTRASYCIKDNFKKSSWKLLEKMHYLEGNNESGDSRFLIRMP